MDGTAEVAGEDVAAMAMGSTRASPTPEPSQAKEELEERQAEVARSRTDVQRLTAEETSLTQDIAADQDGPCRLVCRISPE